MLLRLWLILTVLVGGAAAQSAGGAISGTVTDPAGAVVPGAEVAVENVNTGEIRKLASSTSGLYSAPDLPPGAYRITVTSPGFSAMVRNGLEVQVGSELVVNLQLSLGSASQKVEVTAEAPVVDAASSSMGAVTSGPTVRELPLNGRDWTQLAALEPGVAVVRTQSAVALANTRANRGLGNQMAVGGSRPQQNNYLLDGISVNDYSGGGPASVLGASLGVDAIQEFSVVTGNAPADYGKTSGGVINAVTRAGTNEFHGSAYEFLRNSAMDARNTFDPSSPPPFKRNQFGGSLGGPIRKNKTFFFVDYEGLRQGLGVTTVDTVPSANAHNGILTTGTVKIDPKVAPYLAFFPLPNGIVKGDSGTYTFSAQDITPENFLSTRIDQHLSDRDLLHGTYLLDRADTTGPDVFGEVLLGTLTHRQTASIEESHVFSPTVVNFARAGVNRDIAEAVKSFSPINPSAADLSLGFVPGKAVGQINIAGDTIFPGGMGSAGEYHWHYTSYQVYDDLSITKSAHSLKVGGGYEYIQSNELGAGASNGTAVFGSISAFLSNTPTSFTANVPGTGNPLGLRQSIAAGYIEDAWRVRPNLTVNLGMRYEMATVPTEQFGRLATLTSLYSPTIHLGAPYFQNPTTRDFSPRVGMAWDPFGNGKTAIRGGFGIYDSLPLTYQFGLLSVLSAPYLEQGSSTTVPKGSFPDGLYSTISAGALRTAFVEQDPKRNYVMQWNVDAQRELLANLVLDVGYAGSHGVHSPFLSSDVNTVQPTATPAGYVWPTPRGSGVKPLPTVGNVTALFYQVSSTYDALRARLTKRFGHGMQVQGAYTWSKSLDTGSDSFQTAYTNSLSSLPLFDSHIRKSLSDFDIRNVLSINGTWEIPGAQGKTGFVGWIANGWQLGGIMQVASGLPFTATIAGDPLGLNSSIPYDFPDRLNLPGCGNPVNSGSPNDYIKLSCFAAPVPGTRLGDAGRNVGIGPGLIDLDTSLFKNSRLHFLSEDVTLQWRAEIFNVINHPNYSPPTATATQLFTQALAPITSAGTLTSTVTTSRQIQFALKVTF